MTMTFRLYNLTDFKAKIGRRTVFRPTKSEIPKIYWNFWTSHQKTWYSVVWDSSIKTSVKQLGNPLNTKLHGIPLNKEPEWTLRPNTNSHHNLYHSTEIIDCNVDCMASCAIRLKPYVVHVLLVNFWELQITENGTETLFIYGLKMSFTIEDYFLIKYSAKSS